MVKSSVMIPPVKTLILFGGGSLIVEFARKSIKRNIKTYIFAVTRHLEEVIDIENSLTLKAALEREGIPFYHTKDINDSPELKSVVSKDTIGIGVGEAYTFNKETIELFKGRLFDFMVIRLPQYRGGAHFTWQILRRDRIGCWNIQIINEEMIPGVYDSGEILRTREYTIPQWARIPQDYFKIANEEALRLFIEFMDEIQEGKEFKLNRLEENISSYFPRLYTLKHGFINWSWDTDDIDVFVCAFGDPYAGASTFLNEKRVFLKRCQTEYGEGRFPPFMSGLVYRIFNESVFIATKDGALIVRSVMDEKGNNIVKELKVGQRFYTPHKYLEEAMLFNAEYDTEGLMKYS